MKIGRLSLEAQYCWRFVGLAFVVDFDVTRTGDEGIERAVDIDIQLLWLSLACSWVRRVDRYREGEHFIDAMIRVTGEPDVP